MNTMTPRKLTLDDIADVRAYEREREAFKAKVIAMKQRRRLALGPFVSVVFENRDTIRHQIQEMARVERLVTDEEISTRVTRRWSEYFPDGNVEGAEDPLGYTGFSLLD